MSIEDIKTKVKKLNKKTVITVGLLFAVGVIGTGTNCLIVSRRSNIPHMDWYKEFAMEHNLPCGLGVEFTGSEDEAGGDTVFWSEELDEASRKWFKEFAPYSSIVSWNNYSNTALTSYDLSINKFINESKFMENWLNENMKNIVHEGMDVEEAKVTCYIYVLDNSRYDKDVKHNNLAKTVVETHLGACSGFSALYRDMINWMDFDENWKLTFDKDKAVNKMDMLIVGGNGHAWNAMQDRDGSWKYFDLTFDSSESNAMRTKESLKFYNLSADEFYTDEEYTVGEGDVWVRPVVENREGLHVYIKGQNDKFADGVSFK